MDIELIKKLDELIDIFDNSDEIKNLTKLKDEIYQNEELREKLNIFNKLKDNVYSDEYLKLKKDILSINSVREYKRIENDLFLLTLSINQKLNNLIEKKGCHHENN